MDGDGSGARAGDMREGIGKKGDHTQPTALGTKVQRGRQDRGHACLIYNGDGLKFLIVN